MSLQIVRKLSGKQLEAAQLVADGELTEQVIADRLSIARRTLDRWKVRPDFEQHVSLIRIDTAAKLKGQGIRIRENRLAALQERQERLLMIVEDRSKDSYYSMVPGYRSGYMTHNVKFGGGGDDLIRVDLYEVDTGLVSALNAVEKQIAQDTGQWSEKEESATLHGKKTSIINTVYVGVPRPDFAAIAVQQVVEIDE